MKRKSTFSLLAAFVALLTLPAGCSSSSKSGVMRAAPRSVESRTGLLLAMAFRIVFSSIIFHAEIAWIDDGGNGFDPIGAAVKRISVSALP